MMRKFRSNYRKYHNLKTTIDGITFDSKAEAEYYAYLTLLQKAGEVVKIERQVPFELQPKYKRHGKTIRAITYLADFVVTFKNGRQEVYDVKGIRTDVFKLKLKLLLYKYPDINFVEIHGKTRVEC